MERGELKESAVSPPALPIRGRRAIEGYLERLNRASPVAERRIAAWGREDKDVLYLSAQPLGAAGGEPALLAECELGFALDVQTRDTATAPRGHVVGLLLAGAMTVLTRAGEVSVQAGEGVILDPTDVERSRLLPGTRFVEFSIAGEQMARLCRAWSTGLDGGLPAFVPKLARPLAHKLAFMAAQAAAVQHAEPSGMGPRLHAADLAGRWTEMIALTLLDEQPMANAPTASQVLGFRGPAPATVRRAMEFMQAHADTAIDLADIAEAARTSPRSLLRHFQAHLGTTPAAFLRGIRLERARLELRTEGADAIRDIALRWGFQNASKFSQAYQRRYGHTPSRERGSR